MVYGTLDKIDAADINWYINININATTYMTQLLLPKLLNRPNANLRSAIFCISSPFARDMTDVYGPYGALKRYVEAFTATLQKQYSNKIDSMLVIPGSVKSGFNPGTMKNSVSTEEHCKTVIDHLGRYGETRGARLHAYHHWSENDSPWSLVWGPYARYQLLMACKAVCEK